MTSIIFSGITHSSKFAKDTDLLKYFDQYWNELCSILLCNNSIDMPPDEYAKMLQNIRTFYFQNSKVRYKDIIQLFNEAKVLCSDIYFIHMVKKVSAQPIFVYNFEYKVSGTIANLFYKSTWTSVMTSLALRHAGRQGLFSENKINSHKNSLRILFLMIDFPLVFKYVGNT